MPAQVTIKRGGHAVARPQVIDGHATKPPARYTEASLVKELEEREIGRPSTYASIIRTITARDYVFKKGSALVPTWLAFAVTRLLEEHFSELVDYAFTAQLEEQLDEIASGEARRLRVLTDFYFGPDGDAQREMQARGEPDLLLQEAADVEFEPDAEEEEGDAEVGDRVEDREVLDVDRVEHEARREEADEGWQSHKHGREAEPEGDDEIYRDGRHAGPVPPSR